MSSNRFTLIYSIDSNQSRLKSISSSGGKAKAYGYFNYDTRGNIIHNSHFSMSYNLANQMTAANGFSFTYDGFNRRVKSAKSGSTAYYHYSQDGKLLFSESNGVWKNYIYIGSRLIAKDSSSSASFIHTDILGSTTAQSNNSGTLINNSRRHYKPFGDTYETASNEIGYAGHKFDSELGLSYMQARYYDPVIGRFYSNDPVGFKLSDISTFNRYSYVSNNPYKYVDPDGREKHTVSVTGEAIAVAGARVSLSLSFDDQTLELSASVSASPRLGAGLSLTPSYQQSPSGDVAKNETIVETSVNADAAVGPFAVAQDLVSEKTINGDIQPQGSVSEPQGDAKGKIGVSASVGVEVKVTQSTTAIADAVNAVKEILE